MRRLFGATAIAPFDPNCYALPTFYGELIMFWRLLCVAQFYSLLAIYTYLGLTPHPENSVPVFNELLMHFIGYCVAALSIIFARPIWPLWQRAAFLIIYSIAMGCYTEGRIPCLMPPEQYNIFLPAVGKYSSLRIMHRQHERS